ncbi:zinc-dependent alcohol dehydrogenase family protein [Erwinia sp. BNK-24-b]|uniref:zinc-dependent alcohol dehydrogenase family protein n=1 Tax=unclassified Erwinia TaxID=2622719 RepID=UPI0039BFC017
MQSYRLEHFGSLDGLKRVEEPQPVPGADEVLIKVRACSLNYRDLAILYGTGTLSPKEGLIPISDGAGEVVATGEAVSLFAVGDRVAGSFFPYWFGGAQNSAAGRGAYGTQADGWLTQYKVVNQEGLVAIPDYLSWEEAATLPCAGVTAWNSLQQSRPIRPGETVLTLGTGGVALYAVQFAKLSGARVIALTSNDEKAQLLTTLGADHIINYRQYPEWSGKVRELTDGEGVSRVVEVGGPGTLQQSLLSTAPGGEIALIGFVADGNAPIDFMSLLKSSVTVRPFSVGSRADFIAMNRALNFSKLRPVVGQVFSFEQTAEAWRYFDSRQHVGKVVITVNE